MCSERHLAGSWEAMLCLPEIVRAAFINQLLYVPEFCRKCKAWCFLLPDSCFQGSGALNQAWVTGYQKRKIYELCRSRNWLMTDLREPEKPAYSGSGMCVPGLSFCITQHEHRNTRTWSEWLLRCQEFWLPGFPQSPPVLKSIKERLKKGGSFLGKCG